MRNVYAWLIHKLEPVIKVTNTRWQYFVIRSLESTVSLPTIDENISTNRTIDQRFMSLVLETL